MRSTARSLLAGMVALGLLNLPAFGAAEQPLGTVIQTQDAHLSNANAQIGATVYPGDTVATESDGTLRLRVGTGQVYLGPSSSASLSQIANIAHIAITRGTVGFAAVTSDQLELETPLGMIRPASGQRAQGQVTITGPNQMIVSAYSGALVVERNGESRTIDAGKSYSVTLDQDTPTPDQAPSGTGSGSGGNGNRRDKGALIFDTIVIGGTAVAGYFIWHYMTESTTSPD